MQLNLSRDLYTNTDCHFIGILSPKSKHLLTLPEEERTGGALAGLLSEMENIEFFKQFSSRTKDLLAKKLLFVTHRADVYLLKQGETENPPQAMFIIMSGVVTESYKPSVISDSPTVWPEKILGKGEFFGHVDIVLGRPPSVNAQTVGYSELLMLKKENFDLVHKVMEAHASRISHYLRTTEAISRFGWSDEEHRVLEIFSKLCTYAENQEVYEYTSKKPFWSYFVVSGECRVTREVTYTVSESGFTKALSDFCRTKSQNNTIKNRVEFEEVKHGYFFGVGEDFSRNHIVASSTLECVLIPRLLLLFKDRELLQKMASDLTQSLPSDQEVLDNYSKLLSTSEKKVEMLKEMFKDKPEMLALS